MPHASKLDIELLFLPPYSPNLNLIERVWKLTKRKCLTNKNHKDFASFRTAIDQCLDGFEDSLKPELKIPAGTQLPVFPESQILMRDSVSKKNFPSF